MPQQFQFAAFVRQCNRLFENGRGNVIVAVSRDEDTGRLTASRAKRRRELVIAGDGELQPIASFAELRARQPKRGEAAAQLAQGEDVAAREKSLQRLSEVVLFRHDAGEPRAVAREGVIEIEVGDEVVKVGGVAVARVVFIAALAQSLRPECADRLQHGEARGGRIRVVTLHYQALIDQGIKAGDNVWEWE